MRHWVFSYGLLALASGGVSLAGDDGPAGALGALLFWIFATLAALSLAVGFAGRGSDGLYSPERTAFVFSGAAATFLCAMAF